MQISASVDLFGKLLLKGTQYSTKKDAEGNFVADGSGTPENVDDQLAWVIESKFECPSINLANMDVDSLGAGSGLGNEKYYTRGIWKGYGVPPQGSEGIFLQIKESDPFSVYGNARKNPDTGAPLTGSLVKVCGFESEKLELRDSV